MTTLLSFTSRADLVGGIASTLCFFHCLLTPVLFVASAGLTVGEASQPWWWGILDLLFLALSVVAVYWSAKKTSKRWIAYALWLLWATMALLVANEKTEIMHLAESIIYLPSIGLIALHFYNWRFCSCANENCCVSS